MFKRILSIGIFLLALNSTLFAQYTQVGNGGFPSYTYGPMSTIDSSAFFNRHAYIYPAATIAGLQHGDTIRSIAFMRDGSDTLAGTANFKIYIKNTARANFGSSALNWKAEVRDSGLTKVYDAHPRVAIGNTAGLVTFYFNQNPYYVFDTTGNAINLEILVEYTQQTNQINPIAWYNESSYYVPGFVSNNEAKYLSGGTANWNDSISTNSFQIKPTIRFNHPSKRSNVEVRNIYALGRYPIKMHTADSVKAIIENIGLDTVFNHKFYLEASGVNSYLDSLVVDTMLPYQSQIIAFGNYQPINQGTETLTVRADTDDDPTDNANSKLRSVNYNVYTHADPFNSNAGGIGFNGSTGDFVAKFYVGTSDYINQVKVDFSSSNRSFQIGIWEDDGPAGLPGTNIYTSDTMLTTAGTFILNLTPKVKVTGGYFVGVRQTSNTNVAFSYQPEVPVRPHVFYFAAPLGDTSWVPFSPGFNFNFNIQPRIQVANDLAISKIIVPAHNSLIEYDQTDSIEPRIEVSNHGTLNQNSALINLKIYNRFNQVVYNSNRVINVLSESSTQVSFDKFSLYNLGEFRAVASVNLNLDSVKDNNSLESIFTLYKNHDVAVDIIFEPSDGDTFEIKKDGFWPQVRIFNYGRLTQTNFPVTIRLLKDSIVLSSQTVLRSLVGGASEIVVFDSIFPQTDGWLVLEAFTGLDRDSFPENDTSRVIIYGRKSIDLAMLSILKPIETGKYATKTNFKPFVEFRNIGLKQQAGIKVYARIYNSAGVRVYLDSFTRSLNYYTTAQALFKDFFTGNVVGKYRFEAEVYVVGDQDESNDTLVNWFEVVEGRDLNLIQIDSPYMAELINANSTPRSIHFTVSNKGILDVLLPAFKVEVTNGHVLFFADTVYTNQILKGDTIQLASKAIDFKTPGSYTIRIINIWALEDKRSANDTVTSTYVVKYKNDIRLIEALNPEFDDSLDLYAQMQPSISCFNSGSDTAANAVVYKIIDPLQQTFYTDTIGFTELPPDSELEIFTNTTLIFNKEGTYTIFCYLLNTDDNTNNDTIQGLFKVYRNFDIAIDSAELPLESKTYLIKTTYQPAIWISNKGLQAITDSLIIGCRITVDGNEIYNHYIDTAISAGTSAYIKFDSSLRYPEISEAKALFYLSHLRDKETNNDSLLFSFYFSDNLRVTNYSKNLTEVYPNPFSSSFSVHSNEIMKSILLYDVNGKQQLSLDNLNKTECKIDTELSAGIYYLKVIYNDHSEIIKLIRQ